MIEDVKTMEEAVQIAEEIGNVSDDYVLPDIPIRIVPIYKMDTINYEYRDDGIRVGSLSTGMILVDVIIDMKVVAKRLELDEDINS